MNQQDWAKWCVARTPLESLWNDDGPLKAQRIGERTTEQIRQMLREKSVSFVAADVGLPLQWHTGKEACEFWAGVKTRICDDLNKGCRLEDFPDESFFFAEEWRLEDGETVILLIHCH